MVGIGAVWEQEEEGMSGVAVLAVLAVLLLALLAPAVPALLLLRIPCVRMQVFFAYFFLVTTLANLTRSPRPLVEEEDPLQEVRLLL